MGGLHGARYDAAGLLSNRHFLRLLLQKTGDLPRFSAGWLQHGHNPYGNVLGRQLHHGHRTSGESRGDVRTGSMTQILKVCYNLEK